MHQSPEIPLPLLVTGVAGVSGYGAFRYFHAAYGDQVVGMRQEDNWPLSGPRIVACNAEDPVALARLFEEHRFAEVLNCAGNCALKKCEFDPAMAWRINVDGVNNLIDVISRQRQTVRLLHLSIDLVFSGKRGGSYRETDSPDPVTQYGKSMVVAEQAVQARLPDATILRISLPMGVSFNGHAGAIDWIQSRFQKNKPATLYYDEVRTPTYTDCLNGVFAKLLTRELPGIYHAGGPRRLSLYQIAQVVNRVGGYDPELLQGCYRRDAGPMPPRAGNVTMDSSRLIAALDHNPFSPWPLNEEFVPTDPDWHSSRSDGFTGSPELLHRVLYRNPAKTMAESRC